MRPRNQRSTGIRVISLILCGIILTPSLALAATRAEQLRSQRAAVQSQIRQVRKELKAVKARESHTRRQLSGVQHQVRTARGQLNAATLKLQRTQAELNQANRDLKAAKAELEQNTEQAQDRLVSIYQRGELGYMELMLSARSFGELLDRAQVARFLIEQDKDTLDEFKARKERVAKWQTQVKRKSSEVAAWRQQVSLLHKRAQVKQVAVTHTLVQVKEARQETEAELAALERDSNEIAAMLRRMHSSSSGKNRKVYSASGLPCAGRLGSRFGMRFHPILRIWRMHTGVDIAAPSGTPIHAAGSGEVVYAARRGGYGNCVIIDHGGGITTLYAHMSRYAVRSGQSVSKGQVIGYVGSTGLSTGPHLHYERRKNGAPVNPL